MLLRRAAPRLVRALSTAAPAPPPTGPNHRSLLALDGDTIRPFVQPNAYVAPSASVIGSVVANDFSAVMYGSVVRGDLALIHLGAYVRVLDNSTLTAGVVDGQLSPADAVATGLAIAPELSVGDFSTVGPNAALSSCVLEGRNVVGAGCVVNAGVRIGWGSVVEANSVVPPDVEIPPGEVWAGNPAQKVRDIGAEEVETNRSSAESNVTTTQAHMYEFLPFGTPYFEKEKLAAAAARAESSAS
jgi:gamma-carbonic anhydrase